MIISKRKFFLDRNQKYSNKFDYYSYIWYRYHRLFFGSLIFRGRKLWAFNFFVRLKYELKIKENVDPFWIFLIALMKITPEVLLFPKKRGGGVQLVPLPISERKQFTFGVKWVIKLLRDKNRIITIPALSEALISAVYDKGVSIEKKDSVHVASDMNRHLARFFR